MDWAKNTLERLGYRAVALTDPVEALKTFASDPSHFDLVITDQAMPSMSGMKLARELLNDTTGHPHHPVHRPQRNGFSGDGKAGRHQGLSHETARQKGISRGHQNRFG